jgi:phospholipid/cholesterol/gamma-HCH transport system substrate-binding protein
MYSKVNYTIVGIFVVIFSVGMVWFAFWLAKYGLQEDYKLYKIEMKDSIAGLSKDSSVKLHGVDIGRVSQISIDPNNIEIINILLAIKEEIPIKEDMVASTQMLGVTGLLSIEIHGGSNSAKTLVATETYIPVIKSKPSLLSEITGSLGGLSEKINTLLTRTKALLSNENIDNISKILNNVEKMSAKGEDVELKAVESMKEIDITLKEFRVSIANMNKKFTQIQEDFSEIKGVTVPTVDKIMQTSKNFNRVTLKFEKSLDRGDYNLKKMIEPMLVDIQILSKQLNDMTRELGNNPSDLLFKSRESRRGPGE